MKKKISISLDAETDIQIEHMLSDTNSALFRNKSHVIEYAIKKLLKESIKEPHNDVEEHFESRRVAITEDENAS